MGGRVNLLEDYVGKEVPAMNKAAPMESSWQTARAIMISEGWLLLFLML